MAQAVEYQGSAFEDGGAAVRGLLTGFDGTVLVQSDFDGGGTIEYQVIDLETGSTVVSLTGVTVADVLSDSLDADGYNLNMVLGPAAFPNGRRTYRVEIKFTLASGSVGWSVVNVPTLSTGGD